jgi:hemerythrin superfamily protein
VTGIATAVRRGMSKDDTSDVLEILTAQHEEVDELIEKLENGKDDAYEVFQELANKLAAHATIEEKIFYPSVLMASTEEMLQEAVEEHLSVKRILADMLELDPEEDQDEFMAKLSVLKEQVSHHAHEEEEGKLFPILRRQMGDDDLSAIGSECLAMFEALMEEEPSAEVPGETDRAAPLQG